MSEASVEDPKSDAAAAATGGAADPTGPAADADQAPTPPPKSDMSDEERRVRAAALINVARTEQGLGMLRESTVLLGVAQAHAADLIALGYFGYRRPDGSDGIEAKLKSSGYRGATGVSLSRGQSEPSEVVAAWLVDEHTRAGLLRPEYRELGIGVRGGSWVIVLGAPERLISDADKGLALSRINGERKNLSLRPLERAPALDYAAQRYSLDLINQGAAEQQTLSSRAENVGFAGELHELVVHDTDAVEAALSQWLSSADGRRELFRPEAQLLGLGMADGVWTALLGIPKALSDAVDTARPQVLSLLNQARLEAKVPTLGAHAGLDQAAQAHADDMVANKFFNYEQPGRPGVIGQVKQTGYRGRAVPTISRGQSDATGLVRSLLGNSGHRKNLLDPECRQLGVGVREGHWVLVLGVPTAEASDELRQALLSLINAQRMASKVRILTLSPLLTSVAQTYADDMVRRNYFGFNNPEGAALDSLAQRNGYAGRTIPALARGHSTPEGALDAWWKSPQNRQNLLEPQLGQLGIGIADSRWVLLLGM